MQPLVPIMPYHNQIGQDEVSASVYRPDPPEWHGTVVTRFPHVVCDSNMRFSSSSDSLYPRPHIESPVDANVRSALSGKRPQKIFLFSGNDSHGKTQTVDCVSTAPVTSH
jgi:hypothetical protein